MNTKLSVFFRKENKTDTRSNISLLPIASALLEKYKDYPQVINEEKLLPILSNQKMNSYLKEIADVCEINKELTFHIVGIPLPLPSHFQTVSRSKVFLNTRIQKPKENTALRQNSGFESE